VRLALAIDQHRGGYIDAYFGPPEWKAAAQREGKRPLDELSRTAGKLAEAIASDASLDPQRRDFMGRHVRGMQMTLRLLSGERVSLADEAESVYDIRPTWTDEAGMEEAQRELAVLLPPGGTLLERLTKRKRALEIPIQKVRELLPYLCEYLRELARARLPLAEDESLDIEFVSGHPWSAYNWYLGAGRSRIEINTDLPQRADRLVELVAHEAYPGHHTELSIKDARLHVQQGRLEHSLILLNSPSAVVSEGIATSALSVILPGESLDAWYAHEVLPRVGLDAALARGASRIAEIQEVLDDASDNAAFLLHERGAQPEEVVAYLQKYKLFTEGEARKRLDFISDPLDRTYVFTYGAGRKLLKALFAQDTDVTRWYTHLVTEPVTPSQIRGWMRE
jgi:hypothetical protein